MCSLQLAAGMCGHLCGKQASRQREVQLGLHRSNSGHAGAGVSLKTTT